jgi:Xaa-Pro dipeptidase
LASLRFQGQWAFIGDDLNYATKIGIPVEQRNRHDVISSIEHFRTLKSEFEVASILDANVLALKGHQKLADIFQTQQISELELHYEYLKATQQTDLNAAYNDIVALGKNCGILHHVHYEKTRITGDTSLLVDAGALCHGYASDITRTWVRGSGEAAEAFRTLIRGVDVAQQVLVSEFKVGVPYESLHNSAHKLLADVLVQVGLATCSAEALVNQGVTRLFFPHGLGHSLGLQVHDVGMRLTTPAANNPYLRNTSVIIAGQVVTIEPGIYFIPRLMNDLRKGPLAKQINEKLLVQLEPFGGIRIEDNILATEAGPVNLTR